MFEAAREAMEKGEASQAPTTPNAETQETSSPVTDQGASSYAPQETQGQTREEILQDLEKLERFTFKGKEYTARDLESAMMRQQDYTRKTQELASERRFVENVDDDIENVLSNPSLAAKFKEIYPEKYHAKLDRALNTFGRMTQTQKQTPEEQSWRTDPELAQMKRDVTEWKAFQTAEQQKQAEKTIDNILEQMATKFKVSKEMRTVAEEMVVSRANVAINQNLPLNRETWEKIYSGVHKELSGIAKSYNQELIKQQQDANAKARDASSGGQAPGQSPKRMSFREATEAAVRDSRNA